MFFFFFFDQFVLSVFHYCLFSFKARAHRVKDNKKDPNLYLFCNLANYLSDKQLNSYPHHDISCGKGLIDDTPPLGLLVMTFSIAAKVIPNSKRMYIYTKSIILLKAATNVVIQTKNHVKNG